MISGLEWIHRFVECDLRSVFSVLNGLNNSVSQIAYRVVGEVSACQFSDPAWETATGICINLILNLGKTLGHVAEDIVTGEPRDSYDTLNFWLVPPPLRVLYSNCVSVVWEIYLSRQVNKKLAAAAKAQTQECDGR